MEYTLAKQKLNNFNNLNNSLLNNINSSLSSDTANLSSAQTSLASSQFSLDASYNSNFLNAYNNNPSNQIVFIQLPHPTAPKAQWQNASSILAGFGLISTLLP